MSKWLLIPIDDDNGNGNGGGGGGGGSFGPLGLCLLPFIICDLFGYRALDDLSLERPLLLASNIPSMVLVVALFVFALLCCFDILKEYYIEYIEDRGILTAVILLIVFWLILLIVFGLILFTVLNLYLFGIGVAYELNYLTVIFFIGIPSIVPIVVLFFFAAAFSGSSLRHFIFLCVTLALFPVIGFVQFYFLNGLGLLNIVPAHDSTLVEIQYANLEKAVRLNRKSVTQTDEEVEAMIKREWKRFQAKNSVPWFVGKTLKNNRRETIKFSKGKAFYLTYYNEEDDKVRLDGEYTVNVKKKTITCKYDTRWTGWDSIWNSYSSQQAITATTVFSYNDILLYMDDESDASDTWTWPFISDSAEFDAEEAKFLFGKKFEVDGKSLEFSKEGNVLLNGEEAFSYIVDAPLKTIVAFYEENDIGFISQYTVDKKGNVTVIQAKSSVPWFMGKTLKNQYETITLSKDGRVVATYNSGEIEVEGKYTVSAKNKTLTCKYKTIRNHNYRYPHDTNDTDVFSYSDILLYIGEGDSCDVLEGPFISDSAEFDAEDAKFLFGKKFEVDDGMFVEFSKEGKVLLNGAEVASYIVDEPIKTIVAEGTKGEEFSSFIGKYNVDTEGNVTVTIDGHEITSQ